MTLDIIAIVISVISLFNAGRSLNLARKHQGDAALERMRTKLIELVYYTGQIELNYEKQTRISDSYRKLMRQYPEKFATGEMQKSFEAIAHETVEIPGIIKTTNNKLSERQYAGVACKLTYYACHSGRINRSL